MRLYVIRKPALCLLVGVLACGAFSGPAGAQDLPTDAQIQAAFGTAYNHLGLVEYCTAKRYAKPADVANTRKMVEATVAGMVVSAASRSQEAVGQHGNIVGEQLIGLMDPNNPAHPEMVPDGRTVSLADNARAQKISERTLCGQMAAQAAPLR